MTTQISEKDLCNLNEAIDILEAKNASYLPVEKIENALLCIAKFLPKEVQFLTYWDVTVPCHNNGATLEWDFRQAVEYIEEEML